MVRKILYGAPRAWLCAPCGVLLLVEELANLLASSFSSIGAFSSSSSRMRPCSRSCWFWSLTGGWGSGSDGRDPSGPSGLYPDEPLDADDPEPAPGHSDLVGAFGGHLFRRGVVHRALPGVQVELPGGHDPQVAARASRAPYGVGDGPAGPALHCPATCSPTMNATGSSAPPGCVRAARSASSRTSGGTTVSRGGVLAGQA